MHGGKAPSLPLDRPECERSDPRRKILPDGCPLEYGDDVSGALSNFLRLLLIQKDNLANCFADLPASGHSSSLPPETARCWDNPEKKCVHVPLGSATQPWEYSLPTDDPVWNQFELDPKSWGYADSFFKRIYYRRDGETCTIELQAKSDINRDGVFMTFARPLSFPIGEDPVANLNLMQITRSTEYPGGDKFPPEPPIFSNDWLGR